MEQRGFENKYYFLDKRQIWRYNGGCEYKCEAHKGKVEWHHPLTEYPEIGLWLCELHHSLIQGRRRRASCELILDKTLKQMWRQLKELEAKFVLLAGHDPDEIDKH